MLWWYMVQDVKRVGSGSKCVERCWKIVGRWDYWSEISGVLVVGYGIVITGS